MAQPPSDRPRLDRRSALRTAALTGVGVPLLAACGSDGDAEETTKSSAPSTASPSVEETGSAPSGLTTTAEIPEGGGQIFEDERVVITQPTAGTFVGLSAVCTHRGCLVSEIAGDEIVCKCHSSRFSITDGSVQGGPADAPLEKVELAVEGDSISLA